MNLDRGRRVPLARRHLFAEPRRLAAAVSGVGLALMLILLLDGLWAGVQDQVTMYVDNAGADLYVAERGSRNFLAGASTIPADTVDAAAADPDVQWAAPVRGLFSILDLHGRKIPAYVVGSVPGRPGGPWSMKSGRTPRIADEVVVGDLIERRHGVGPGDTVEILGRRFRVVGVANASTFMTSFVFMTHEASDTLLRSPDTTSFVLVRTDRPDAVRERLAAGGTYAVLDLDQLRESDMSVFTRAFGAPLRVMRLVAFAAGTLIIALTAFTSIAERRREYGIIKAMGAGLARLVSVALGQTLMLAVLGLAAGAVFLIGGRQLIEWARPQFLIVITVASVARTAVVALVMGTVAAVLPARRLASLDPATAYRDG